MPRHDQDTIPARVHPFAPMHAAHPERAILGYWLLWPSLLDARRVEPAHFPTAIHRSLAEFLISRRQAGRFTLAEEVYDALEHDQALSDRMGGYDQWAHHTDYPSVEEAYPYWEQMLIRSHRRATMLDAASTMSEVVSQTGDLDAAESAARGVLARLELDRPVTSSAQDVGDRIWADFDEQACGRRDLYLPTGWDLWDRDPAWQGWSTEGTTLVLARSGMGKTSLVNTTAINMASAGVNVYVHGTETSPEKRLTSMAFGVARVDPRRWSFLCRLSGEGRLNQSGLEELDAMVCALRSATAYLRALPLHLSGGGLTVDRVRNEALRRWAAGSLDVLIVDYLQDFAPSRQVKAEKQAQTEYASRLLKDLSSEMRRPVIVTAQVSDEKATAGPPSDPLPQMWHCQWASGAHQDAEEIYSLNRGDYWKQHYPGQYDPTKHGPEGAMQICARKRRTGDTSTLEMRWQGVYRWVGPLPSVGV